MILRQVACISFSNSLAIMVIAASVLSAQTAPTINVNEPRPLSGAIDALERVGGIPINYEDPPYEYLADVQDVSTPQQRAARPGYQLLVPRSGQVTAQLQPIGVSVSAGDVLFDVNLLLANYRQNNLPGDFTVEQANGMIYVVATSVLGANSVVRQVTSPMATVITVPYAQRSVADTAQAIFDAVNQATGLKIVIGTFPFLPTQTVSFGVSSESARDALAELFAQTAGRAVSYRLTFDPKPDTMRIFDYMINIRPTGYTPAVAPPSLGPIQVSPSGLPSSQKPSGPGPGYIPAQ